MKKQEKQIEEEVFFQDMTSFQKYATIILFVIIVFLWIAAFATHREQRHQKEIQNRETVTH